MNLTFATLDGFLCHDGGMEHRKVEISSYKTWQHHDLELEIRKKNPEGSLLPATLEAALVKIADTASYLERDLNDAVTLGIVRKDAVPVSMFADSERSLTEIVGKDIIAFYRQTGSIGLSEQVYNALQQIRAFNFTYIYVDERLKTESRKIHNIYEMLFNYLLKEWADKGKKSILWGHFLHNKSASYVAKYPAEQVAIDYIAGMTDGYFLRLFEELYFPRMITVPDVLPF